MFSSDHAGLPMTSAFTTRRERRLWTAAVAVAVAIYATAGLAGTLVGALSERLPLEAVFGAAFLLVLATIVGSAWKRRAGHREIWVLMGVVAVYTLVIVRLGIAPRERTHLIEYGVLALLIHQALRERRANGSHVPLPGVVAVVATSLLGWGDEAIQAFLPDRVYDPRDIGFNVVAAIMAVSASSALRVVRRWDDLAGASAE